MGKLLDILKDYNPTLMSNGEIKMDCPFRENHPDGKGHDSFFISPDKGLCHCFSCGKGIKLFSLLTVKFELSVSEALDISTPTIEDYHKDKPWEMDISYEVTPPKEFLGRGFSKKTLGHFKFGYTEDGWILIPFYERFTKLSKLIGYQKRKQIHGKRVVINSKGFKKADYLYNLDTSYDYVIVVEGYSDVMRLYQFGYNAVALLGADISDWQAEQIRKFQHVYLATDNDNPGRRAIEKLYFALKDHTDVMLIPYPTKDPGECISKKIWDKAFFSATDYVTYSLQMAMGWDGYLDMRDDVIRMMKRRMEENG